MGRKDVSEDDLHAFVDGLAALGAALVLAPPPPPLSELARALCRAAPRRVGVPRGRGARRLAVAGGRLPRGAAVPPGGDQRVIRLPARMSLSNAKLTLPLSGPGRIFPFVCSA